MMPTSVSDPRPASRLARDIPQAPLDMPEAPQVDGGVRPLMMVGVAVAALVGGLAIGGEAYSRASAADSFARNQAMLERQGCAVRALLLGEGGGADGSVCERVAILADDAAADSGRS
ncbi:hypothetical protein [Rubellimicrobium aerolatum]|uniref:Uncharacterized protein n=1 Tax=Rubellimicrobium aerolatum TaxID=490979 RepID=A0ABW0SF32_9RHOB|nr:hypothetical protein [Rubellimicrobium aerolatum]MBP1807096.1 hypothetical protein [Rubellimicrobium aerolatum]